MRDNRPNEDLLHFIWQLRYFNQRELTTASGERLFVDDPGQRNGNQGPDFLYSRIHIGDTLLTGAVELHVRASDWQRHGHDADPHYRQVILHAVWENDRPSPPGGIPIVILQDRTPKTLLDRYQDWMENTRFIPCESLIAASSGPTAVDAVFSHGWSRQLIRERLLQRTAFIQACLDCNCGDWEQTTWWLLARSMGQPVNADAFFAIARSLPLKLLLRHRGDTFALQALLLGQAGLLEDPLADTRLKAEYKFYSAKYRLCPPGLPLSFLRMRPAHFPTRRLMQLAGLLSRHGGWFTLLCESKEACTAVDELRIDAPQRALGAMIKKSILLNAFIPILYAYGVLRQEAGAKNKALRWLHETPMEHNAILTQWERLGIAAPNAAQSQALLELTKNYCRTKRCLECAIGRRLLRSPVPSSNEIQPSPPCRDGYCT